jgi:hypothetical protein
MYFLTAVFFLLVVILAVPGDDTRRSDRPDEPLAIGPALLIPQANGKGPQRP